MSNIYITYGTIRGKIVSGLVLGRNKIEAYKSLARLYSPTKRLNKYDKVEARIISKRYLTFMRNYGCTL